MNLYFDYNAITPTVPHLNELVQIWQSQGAANPSSRHRDGRDARRFLEKSRANVAEMLGCDSREIVWNSGATEGANTVARALWSERKNRFKILVSAVEHDAVLRPLKALVSEGAQLVTIPVSQSGELDVNFLKSHLDDSVLLVAVQWANNETGIVIPPETWVPLARSVSAYSLCDLSSALGRTSVSLRTGGPDFALATSGKLYAPAGSGFLYQKFGLQLAPLMTGGFQEKGLRAGTENSLGAFLLAEGFKYVEQSRMRLEGIFQNYRHQICDALSGICPGTIIVEHPSLQIKSTLNVLLPGLDAKTVVARLDLEGISVSTGSACHSGSMDLSPVLLAMGWPPDKVKGAVRISWGLGTTEADVDALIGHFRSILPSMVSIGESYRIQREVSL